MYVVSTAVVSTSSDTIASLTDTAVTTSTSLKDTSSNTKPKEIILLPVEIIYEIFSHLPVQHLINQRLTSHLWKEIATRQLVRDLKQQISALHLEYKHAHTKYMDRETAMRPHVRHYTSFLNGIASSDVTEATWYSSPPEELQTVCECLCLLKESCDSEYIVGTNMTMASDALQNTLTTTYKRIPWSTIKKTMSKYEFRQWVLGLNENVNQIPIQNAKRVEQIIVQDASITYERLREVSLAGYKLLIYVAACLQHVSISHELQEFFKVQDELSKKLYRTKQFLNCIQ